MNINMNHTPRTHRSVLLSTIMILTLVAVALATSINSDYAEALMLDRAFFGGGSSAKSSLVTPSGDKAVVKQAAGGQGMSGSLSGGDEKPGAKTQTTIAYPVSADSSTRTLTKHVLSDEGNELYVVTAIFGDDAEIPFDAQLEVEERVLTDEGREMLRQGLEITEDSTMIPHVVLDIRLVSGGVYVEPKTPIEVEIASTVITPADSYAIAAMRLEGTEAISVPIENLTGVDANNNVVEKPEYSRLKLNVGKMGEYALSTVLTKKDVWLVENETVTIWGLKSATTNFNETLMNESFAEGLTMLRRVRAQVDPSASWASNLWVSAEFIAGAAQGFDGLRCNVVNDEGLGAEVFGPSGSAQPVVLPADTEYAFLWDDGYRTSTVEAGVVSFSGSMPLGVEVWADDANAAYADASAVVGVPDGNAFGHRTITAFDTRFEVKGSAWRPDAEHVITATIDVNGATAGTDLQVWHVSKDGQFVRIPNVGIADGKVSFAMDDDGTYILVERVSYVRELTATDGATYGVTLSYDRAAGLPDGVQLVVREIEPGTALYFDCMTQSLHELGAKSRDVVYAKALDIELMDPVTGMKYQPSENVAVRIEAFDAELAQSESVDVVHFGMRPETMDVALEGNSVVFETDGFSAYVVCAYTVDFYWGEYTYSIAGEEDILLSELLEELGVSEITLDDVEDVSFSDSNLVEINKDGNDWRLRSLESFDTTETLTITLSNDRSVDISVTTERQTEISVPTPKEGLVYTGLEQELVNEGSDTEGTILYSLSRDGEYSTAIPTGTNAGDYTIYYRVEGQEPADESISVSIGRVPLTLTAASETKVYDGYELSSSEYSVEGLVAGDRIQAIVHDGALTDAGERPHILRDGQVVNAAGVDVTACYDIIYVPGTLTITKKPITITADSAEKVYDGRELKAESFTSTGLADGDVFDSVTVIGSQTIVGESENIPSGANIVRPLEGEAVANVNNNYTISYANGILKVAKRDLIVTADSASKAYDGLPLTKETYIAEGLAEGDTIQDVTVTGSQTDAGTSDNVPSTATVLNGDKNDVSDCYNIAYKNGVLEVTKKNVKLIAASGVRVYDGNEKKIDGYSVCADDRLLSGVLFEDSVSASGSGTNVGSYPVEFFGVSLNETVDTTGNYVVAEIENGALLITQHAPIVKTLTSFKGDIASYEIRINSEGLQLNGGHSFTLKDTFTNNQSIDYSSIAVSPNNIPISYDYSDRTGTFVIPDETAIVITYVTRVEGAAGASVAFGNTAQIGVTQNESFASWYDVSVSETRTITPTGTDIEGADGDYNIKLFTYAQNHMEDGLGGAVFRLLDSNQRPITYQAGVNAGQNVTYETGKNGYVTVELDDGVVSIRRNTFYYLEMITAPVKKNDDGSFTYFKKDNTLYRFQITDDPNYNGENKYFNGDILKVRCYPEVAGINVTKRFSGNYALSEAQMNQIRFVLQKEDLASDSWIDVEAHTYEEFTNGSMNFKAGSADGSPLEQAVLYRVIEENVEVEGIDQTGSVTLSYQRDNKTVQEHTNEFEVNPDYSTFSFSLVFDNTYVDHKLTVVNLDELSGVKLSGARFDVYRALDDIPIKTYITGESGALEIRREDEFANYAPDTAYYVVEVKPSSGYLMPKDAQKFYFYFSESSVGAPDGVPSGTTAVDLTTSYDTVFVHNDSDTIKVPVTVTWDVDGSHEWPNDVGSVKVALYQSIDGSDPMPVSRDGNPMEVTLSKDKSFDNTTFVNLPARDSTDNDIAYSVVQDALPGYYTSYKISGTGWYVVKNEPAVSVTVKKEWYDLNNNRVTDDSAKPEVSFDLYRTIEDYPNLTTREELETSLRGTTPVKTGLTLSAGNNWTNTLTSLQKQNAKGDLYYYFVLEREDSMPRNNEDSYAISPAVGETLRTLTIKDTQTPITVIIGATSLSKSYGQNDPSFSFTTEVQDDNCVVSQPVLDEDGKYVVDVTQDNQTKRIRFTCSREEGENVGSYAIKLEGENRQEGYRVRLDDGTLNIMPAQVTVKGKATKVYGDPDPSLVEITGLKEGDTISYYAYRDIGEQKGSYRTTVTGLAKQGNYEITYVNDYLTIEPAPVVVTADNLSKAFGQPDPTLTTTIDGLKNLDAESVIHYNISRTEGESVGDYPIAITGAESQGNYTVTFVPGTFTITGHKVTVRAKNLRKVYGDADPTWEAEVTGQQEGETINYTFTREEGEDVGTYVVTPTGETIQGNCEVVYETGLLTIDRATLTVTPVNTVKALTDPISDDPQLTVAFDGLVNHDDEIVPTAVYEAGTWTYTYTRAGETEPEFAFTLTRTPGETAGPYIIAAAAFGERPRNYNITYKTGVFTILATYSVLVNQHTRDLVDYTQNPEYSYSADLDLSGIGIESYNSDGFEDNHMEFTLPANGDNSRVIAVPAGAKLTLMQRTENPDYATSIALDARAVAGTSVVIDQVKKSTTIDVTHERISLPAQARAAQRQTTDGKADENDAVVVTPLAYLGIPRDDNHEPIALNKTQFMVDLDAQGVYNLPEDRYYVPEHASVYNGENLIAQDIEAIQYDTDNKVWQYKLVNSSFTSFGDDDQLVLFYMPKYICRVQADGERYYTLNDALKHIDELTLDETDADGKVTKQLGEGTIQMLIGQYTMPSDDNLSIPANFDITLTTAEDLAEPAVIIRKPNNLEHMLTNAGTLTLDRVTLDGNKSRITANNAMVLNNGTLTVSGDATLRNASGNNGGALYANGGSVNVENGASFTGNNATNGGAIYFHDGSFTLATENVTGNTATYGGAVYIAETDNNANTFELTGTGAFTGNSATGGAAVYMTGGKLETSGVISGNNATNGGAIFIAKGTLDFTGGKIESNQATSGGAIYMAGGAMFMSGGTASGNTAQESGGMLYASNATVELTGGSITGNTASTNGGAIHLVSGSATVGGVAVQGNHADNGFGGAVYQEGGTLTATGTMNGANTAKNGSAVYVQNGSATLDGANITGNITTEGGAIGVGSAEARLFFAGDAIVTGNTWDSNASNVYLDRDTDLVINTAGLGSNANIGVRVAEQYLTTRGDVACKFGTYTVNSNLSKFKNDVNTSLTACDNNYKIIWSKGVTVQLRKLDSYATGFPPSAAGTNIRNDFTYYPKSKTNNIYDLVMEMYNAVYKSYITGYYVYAYSYADTATEFSQFLSAVNWDSANQRWDFVERTGNKATGTPKLRVYYSQGAYISIVNNSPYELTVDSMIVLGKSVPLYGYPTVKNNITLNTLTPVTADDLVLKSGENVKLLFPGAVNQNWSLSGTFTDSTTHAPVASTNYKYTLDRTHGGTEKTGSTDVNGRITHSGKTNNNAGVSYEVLFGDPTKICKVTDNTGEHPFATLNAAWNYIIDKGLTYTMEDGTAKPGGTIEMLIDYLQPLSDVLTINEASFTSRNKTYNGYCLKLTTAATSGVQYPYVGGVDENNNPITRATISRDADNGGAAVIAEPSLGQVLTAGECNAFLIADNLTFDGKALAKKGNGGAIRTANNVVKVTNCDFKGYQAKRGGAIFVAWGALTVGSDTKNERCTFTNCSTGDPDDKTGGGAIWTTAQELVVKNCDFDHCVCESGKSQGGGIFHNIRPKDKPVYPGGGDYGAFPANYYLNTSTWIEGCNFEDCYAEAGSGGTVESDSMQTTVKGCSFDGSYSNKGSANGGALNILHNDAWQSKTRYPNSSLTVIGTTFEDCQTQQSGSSGGAICDQNSVNVKIIDCDFVNCSSDNGGAVRVNQNGVTDVTVETLGSRFENCTARNMGGAVRAQTKTMTISDTYTDDNGASHKYDARFKNCSAPNYGGVYQEGNVANSSVIVNNVYFDNCKAVTSGGGALYVSAKNLTVTDSTRDKTTNQYTFKDCEAGGDGGAVHYSTDGNVKAEFTDASFYNCMASAQGGAAKLTGSAIEITAVEVRNCEAVTNGGGLYVSGTTETLTGCVFSGNKATGKTGNGGSLYIYSGAIGITGSSISDSVAVDGGGIYNQGKLTISKGTDPDGGAVRNCSAKASGGGIYATDAVTLIDTVISNCYAKVAGGGIYHDGVLNPYGTITGCYAGRGGGLYSNGSLMMDNVTKTVNISNCHAATVSIAEDGTSTADKEYNSENLGGGVFKAGGDWNLGSPLSTINGCSAFDGGAVYYNTGGTLTFTAGNIYANIATNNGGAVYKNAGTINMSGGVIGGSEEDANRAQNGAGIFVADGQKITIGGGRITHNVAEVGGAVAVGGSSANTQLLFQGAPTIKNNTTSSGDKCNVYLNHDSNGIICTDEALTSGAYIGVYVTDEQFARHGNYAMPFGTYNNDSNLSSFFNDRIYAAGLKGSDGRQIVWGEFACKITDADGNLLYVDDAREVPAVYTTLENHGDSNALSAFGMLSMNDVELYNSGGKYSGDYQIQMLVGNYTCVNRIGLTAGKTVTLTTADPEAQDGFPYTGANEFATLFSANTFDESWITNRSHLILKNITMDGLNRVSNDGAKNCGGIVCNKDSGILTIKDNATLKNAGTTTAGGGAIGLHGAKSKLYMEGGVIENCFANGKLGGAVYFQDAGAEFHMSGGIIRNCSAKSGGAVYATGKVYMSGGEITGNTATTEGGGIYLKGTIYFSDNPIISGNTLNSEACNLHLINNNNTSIYADGLGPFAEIRVYTTSGQIRNNRGVQGKSFGTWTDNANLHCFINDVDPRLRGMKRAGDQLIYWEINPVLIVGKNVDSDWSADKDVEFNFTVTIVGHEEFSGVFEDMTFVDGTATFNLKAGQVRTASGLPIEFIQDGVNYTVSEDLSEGQTAYTIQYKHNGGVLLDGSSVSGRFGEKMDGNNPNSSSVSMVEFTNTRTTDDLTISKTVTEAITGDYTMPYEFTVTLDDNTINKTYTTKCYQDATDTAGTDETITFASGVASFRLTHGQSLKILDLPTELGFRVEENPTEDQYAHFRVYVTKDNGGEELTYSESGVIGRLHHVAFRNHRYGLVCKIVNDTAAREQLYYRENNDPNVDPTPAIFDELEKAFETINNGINFFTSDGASADAKLRVEMVKSRYAMTRQATLAAGYNVTLGTAKKTDHLYPYPSSEDMPATVIRGFDDGSMFVDNGNLTIDNIILNGDGANRTAADKGGIVQVNGNQTLTVTENATLCNSKTANSGGAIWLGNKSGLVMNGSITGCEGARGGGVYAEDGFGGGRTGDVGITISGAISDCTASAGNGGALCVGVPNGELDVTPVLLTDSAMLRGNRAVAQGNDGETGRGGAVYSAANLEINSESVVISNNIAANDGGGFYLDSSASFSMNGGTISDNEAINGNAGGIWANHISLTNGTFSGNKANGTTVIEEGIETVKNGKGGAIYTKTSSNVTITGTTFTDNGAYQGAAVYDQAATFAMTDATMTGNIAIKNGGAVYVAGGHSFNMFGGAISGNSSPEGAISTGSNGTLNFSGDATVFDNKNTDGTTAMNVYLGYHSNTIINAASLTGVAPIGVYVKDGEDKFIYNNHGIANRPFGTGDGVNLSKFVNDRDNSLTGVAGSNGLVMWPGKNLRIQVYQNKRNLQGQRITPVGGARFSLQNEQGDTVWSGASNAITDLFPGLLVIPWGISETASGGTATFTKQVDGKVAAVTYTLSQQQSNGDTVRPAGTWTLTIGTDNKVTWTTNQSPVNHNRTIGVEAESAPAYLGETFLLFNDVKPRITFDPNGGILAGKQDWSSRTDTIDFSPTDLSRTYTIEESDPTRDNSVFRIWSTVRVPTEGDGHMEYRRGDDMLFYRHTDDDDVTLYALWSTVVCKITDRDDHLLYVNGSPAVYMSLKDGFDAYNEASFTLDGVNATPRKIKMLVGEYEMTETVELARGKTAEFMTAPSTDTDGYAGPENTCVITRASSFDTGSMIVDNYNLALRDIILDGSLKDGSGNPKPINGNGGIVTVVGNASRIAVSQNATLRNAMVSGNGGAIYADGNTTVSVTDGGKITGCQAVNGGAVYADAVNISGGEISGNTATASGSESKGGGVYATGVVTITGGVVKNNTSSMYGGGLYQSKDAKLSMKGGSIMGNNASFGGGVYSDGIVSLEKAEAVICGNTAAQNGGGLYVSDSGSLRLSAGSVGVSDNPNTAVNGGGVYLAGEVKLTGGSISYNTANGGNGGGLYLNSKSEIKLSGTALNNNQASNGGAVYATSPENGKEISLTLAKGTISNNGASSNGGGVYLAPNVSFRMTGGTLGTNTAQDGGGVYVASGSEMTLTKGTLSGNTSTRNGGAIYVAGTSNESHGTLRVENGSIKNNSANGFGGALYLQGYGQLHMSGGTISQNAAKAANGGAINAEGINARIYLSGSPTIFNNPGNAAKTSQKNLVLSVDQNNIINTEETGLTEKIAKGIGGTIGIYVVDEYVSDHGVYDKPFGTFEDTGGNRANAKHLVNDRNLALYGVDKNDGTIYWLDVVCKVTDDKDVMLYKLVDVDDSGVQVYAPAVYTSLADGLDAVSGVLYRKSGSRYAVVKTGAAKVKMLTDYVLDENEIINYVTARNITLTTAETVVSSAMQTNGDTNVFVPGQNSVGESRTKATLTRNQAIDSMFTVNTPNNTFNVSNLIIEGASNSMMTATEVNGGAFNFAGVKSSTFSGVTMQNLNATANGGAIYLGSGNLALKNSSITGSVATNGGAVYVNAGTLALTDDTINGNTSAENGAGIYLTKGSSLQLAGNLNFGGTGVQNDALVQTYANGVTAGNFVSWTYENEANKKNGGKSYVDVRQDIFIEGTAEPHSAICVTGAISSGNGTIWVWAEHVNHYEMLKQFAVFSGNGTKLNEATKTNTMKSFRNAHPDDETNCGGDYLTGQKGEVSNWIYWTGGFDAVFLKANSFGNALSGVTFTLYSDEACEIPFEMTFLDGKRATTVSSDGTATYKDKNGQTVTLERGEVLLSKVPPKTFYLKETVPATGYNRDENKVTYQVTISSTGELTMRKKSSGTATSDDVEVFKETRKRTAGDLEQYVVMNIPEAEGKVILRKVGSSDNTTYTSLAGAQFQILRYDQTLVSITNAAGQTTTTFTSGSNGVYFIDTLPYGVYYLQEIVAPDEYSQNKDKYFCLIIDEDGKYVSEKCYTEQKVALADAQNVLKESKGSS